jgi:hypothetical protein
MLNVSLPALERALPCILLSGQGKKIHPRADEIQIHTLNGLKMKVFRQQPVLAHQLHGENQRFLKPMSPASHLACSFIPQVPAGGIILLGWDFSCSGMDD